MKNYENVLDKLYETSWMILPASLEMIISIVDKKINGESLSEEELRLIEDENKTNRDDLLLPDKPSVAVLPISGPIFPKANLMTQMSGATSVGKLQTDFTKLMESDMVTGIVLDVNSPGGSSEGIQELSDVIYAARESGKKPIYAVANYMAASGSYYLASQANEFFASPSSTLGSIGVVSVHRETSEQDAKIGVKHTVLTVGKNKYHGNPHEPLSDTAKSEILENMQEIYDQFVSDVARGRNTDVETVEKEFGQGRTYKANTALKRGMVDGIATLESIVGKLQNESSGGKFPMIVRHTQNGGETNMPEYTPETLEVLGLGEDATPEMIHTAITELKDQVDNPPVTVPVPEPLDPELAKNPEFAKMAAEVARLRETDRRNTAKMFAGEYAQFTSENGKTGFGFSALALESVEELHVKIGDGVITHSDLKSFLDTVASGNAVVDYREVGSTRGREPVDIEGMEAASTLRDLAYEKMAVEGLSYGDALSKVMEENEELADAYKSAIASRRQFGEGGEN